MVSFHLLNDHLLVDVVKSLAKFNKVLKVEDCKVCCARYSNQYENEGGWTRHIIDTPKRLSD